MRGISRLHVRGHAILSLVLLASNIVAPFHESDLDCPLLDSIVHNVAVRSHGRVRLVTRVSATASIRVVVGVPRNLTGGSADPEVADAPHRPTSRAGSPPRRHADRPIVRTTHPLRC